MNRRSFLKAILGAGAAAVVGVPVARITDKFSGTTATAYATKPLTLADLDAAIAALKGYVRAPRYIVPRAMYDRMKLVPGGEAIVGRADVIPSDYIDVTVAFRGRSLGQLLLDPIKPLVRHG